jgi:hypothetical protein
MNPFFLSFLSKPKLANFARIGKNDNELNELNEL